MNELYELLHPEEKLINKRLTGNSPCVDCENMHRFTRGTSWEEKPVNQDMCNLCMKKIRYDIDCMIKLSWYEDNDNRINNLKRKDKDEYDCGVKCPKRMHKGTIVLYPDGWASNGKLLV